MNSEIIRLIFNFGTILLATVAGGLIGYVIGQNDTERKLSKSKE